MPKKIDLEGNSKELLITEDEINKQIERYFSERKKYFSKELTDDSYAIWLSKEKIQEFLENNKSADGVRIYFAVTEHPNLSSGAHNLIFVPTKRIDEDEERDLTGDNDWILCSQEKRSKEGRKHSKICPPPLSTCKGLRFPRK